jgi:hypothetical protein
MAVNGADEVAANIKRFKEEAIAATKDALNEQALNIRSQAIQNITDLPAVDTGRLRSSIAIEIFDDGLARRIGTDVPYAAYIEFGQRPHMPPIEPIKEWCRRHGIPEEAAYAIALKIAKDGQPAKPWLFPAYEQHRKNLDHLLKEAWARISLT